MKILYYDCFSGISGDMNLGALLDLGVDKDYLLAELARLPLAENYSITIQSEQKMGIQGTRVEILVPSSSARHLADIERIICASTLTEAVKKRSLAIFDVLAGAEAQVHGIEKEKVHFHEVGATDAILDIVGAAVCLEYLQVDKVMASSIELGGGFVRCEHGVLPVPAPAVTELLQGVPVKYGRVAFETTTPTGAAILKTIVQEYTDRPAFTANRIGYGIGKRDMEIPNVLRVYLGEIVEAQSQEGSLNDGFETETQWVLETNIDDMNPEWYEYIEEKLFAAGALDVSKTPMIMKKGRPGTLLRVLLKNSAIRLAETIILTETTAIGLRRYPVQKVMCKREIRQFQTKYGIIKVKFVILGGKEIKAKPEYADCKKLARENNVPLMMIYKELEKSMLLQNME
ncbi:nickel pincer cofactor biosynthesis protein LarC [Dehalobacter sp. DCM]|uniref:nickel pincer cofactor biosynthesis protein LarC n=1 Tax=Dehalobacter sp. DCM TaxID=2907827 RepID=UPI003081C275|nr:nickel pincer cofactor biosynthesis protein LarC [Dehalobacter sp. DCM]